MSRTIANKGPSHFGTTYAARFAGVSPRTVSGWIDSGKLRAFRLPSGFRRIRAVDLIAFMIEYGMTVPEALTKLVEP